MPVVTCNSVKLMIDRRGRETDPAILLIAGLGFQLIDWPDSFCDTLVANGFQVIRFDNRDIGLSQKLDHKGLVDLQSIISAKLTGGNPFVPYQLEDMAADAASLLKELNVGPAHIVGMSMGGMIAQLIAARYPDQVLSLTSIMSSSSDLSLPGPAPAAAAILASAPQSQQKADIVEFGLKVNDVIGSPGFRWNRSELKAHIEACIDRNYSPMGYMRQYAAVMVARSRRELLRKIKTPALVIHGTDDPLVPLACGKDVADHITGSHFESVAGMGHDLSPTLCARLAQVILPHLKAARL
jgi:pimeloyl-ACP methyl ester carboxylesterase